MFKQTVPSTEREGGFTNCRVMVDYVATYWTVVLQARWTRSRSSTPTCENFGTLPEAKEALQGYMELVDGGHREIYKIV